MAKATTESYADQQKELNRQIAENDFSHIYMICGPQDYLRSQNAEKLQQAISQAANEIEERTGIEMTGNAVD
jgi:DNA polymerase III delta subunit